MAAVVAVASLAAQPRHAPEGGAADEPTVHEFEYEWSWGARVGVAAAMVAVYAPCPSPSCAVVDVDPDHRWLELEAVDDAGLPVMLGSRHVGVPEVCGRTDEPIRIGRGLDELAVEVAAGTCPDGTPSLPTTGTLRITLHTTEPKD